jgi:hypothetical protein
MTKFELLAGEQEAFATKLTGSQKEKLETLWEEYKNAFDCDEVRKLKYKKITQSHKPSNSNIGLLMSFQRTYRIPIQ